MELVYEWAHRAGPERAAGRPAARRAAWRGVDALASHRRGWPWRRPQQRSAASRLGFLLALVIGLALSACGQPGAAEPSIDSTVVGNDAPSAEIEADDIAASDVAQSDTVAPDAPDPEGTCPGAAGCPCSQNEDCYTALCLDDPSLAEGKSCARTCVTDCPAGYACRTVTAAGGDLLSVCVVATGRLCEPCSASVDCGSPGLNGSACVDQGSLGKFCGIACLADKDCPASYVCGSVQTAEGNTASQCVKKATGSEAFGTCTCDPYAVAAKLTTTCFAQVKDTQGQVIGQCPGTRLCGPEGLSACDAQSPQPEICDGIDNNCNGKTDDGSCDDGNPCTKDTCDGKGGCTSVPLDGTPCDADGSVCTVADACVAGACAAGKPKDCDDQNPCTSNTCQPTTGCVQANDNGAPCNDDNPCTVGDTCADGGCTAGKPKTCTGTDACTVAKCNQSDGSCSYLNAPDLTPCSDGLQCTTSDGCKDGLCVGLPLACTDDNACTVDSCDPTLGCSFKPAAAGACSDGNDCTAQDACVAGGCTGSAVLCDDGNPCTSDACAPLSGCVYSAASGPCEDGNACTEGDQCQAGACTAGNNTCPCQQDADCPDDGDLCNGTLTCDTKSWPYGCVVKPGTVAVCLGTACNAATCDPKSGSCGLTPLANGSPCDADGSLCTANDACEAGSCQAGQAVSCDDANPCTIDSCDLAKGCSNTAATGPSCDADGDACTQNDTCSAGACIPGKKLACDDNDLCTTDACVAGECVFTAIEGGQPCYDGPPGTEGVGVCHGGVWSCAAQTGPVCVGAQLPGSAESCNGLDDTCNGATDEGCPATTAQLAFGHTRLAAPTLTLRFGQTLPPQPLEPSLSGTVVRWGWLDWLLP